MIVVGRSRLCQLPGLSQRFTKPLDLGAYLNDSLLCSNRDRVIAFVPTKDFVKFFHDFFLFFLGLMLLIATLAS